MKFDETFFAHMEEIDLCWRLKNIGYSVYVEPKSKIYHLGGGTLNKISTKKTFQVSALCLNEVTLEMGLMVGGLILGGSLFFFGVHLIGEKLNRNYRKKEIHKKMEQIADPTNPKIQDEIIR